MEGPYASKRCLTRRAFLLLLLAVFGLALGAPVWSQNEVTRNLQAMIDTGESVILPKGHHQIDAPLNVWSIGQHIKGAGINRTIIEQMTPHAGVFKLHRNEQGSVLAYTWRGPYSGGHGCHHITISNMSLGAATWTGVGIEHDDGEDWDGDFIHLHDLLTYGFETHIHMNGIAHLRFERLICSNATAEQTRQGTGIKVYGATPNSHVMDAITLSGFDIGADILCSGLKGNFGDVGLCNVGLRLNGIMSITGGHFEACDRYIDIGADGPSSIDLRGMHLAVDSTNPLSPIRVNDGSILTGAGVRGAATQPLVECTGWNSHAFIDNHANDWWTGSQNDYLANYSTHGIVARMSPHKLIPADANLPTASALTQGLILRAFNSGNETLWKCRETSTGVFAWGSP